MSMIEDKAAAFKAMLDLQWKQPVFLTDDAGVTIADIRHAAPVGTAISVLQYLDLPVRLHLFESAEPLTNEELGLLFEDGIDDDPYGGTYLGTALFCARKYLVYTLRIYFHTESSFYYDNSAKVYESADRAAAAADHVVSDMSDEYEAFGGFVLIGESFSNHVEVCFFLPMDLLLKVYCGVAMPHTACAGWYLKMFEGHTPLPFKSSPKTQE